MQNNRVGKGDARPPQQEAGVACLSALVSCGGWSHGGMRGWCPLKSWYGEATLPAFVACRLLRRSRLGEVLPKNHPGARLSAVRLYSLLREGGRRVRRRRRFWPRHREWSRDEQDRIHWPSETILPRRPGCPATIHGAERRQVPQHQSRG